MQWALGEQEALVTTSGTEVSYSLHFPQGSSEPRGRQVWPEVVGEDAL